MPGAFDACLVYTSVFEPFIFDCSGLGCPRGFKLQFPFVFFSFSRKKEKRKSVFEKFILNNSSPTGAKLLLRHKHLFFILKGRGVSITRFRVYTSIKAQIDDCATN